MFLTRYILDSRFYSIIYVCNIIFMAACYKEYAGNSAVPYVMWAGFFALNIAAQMLCVAANISRKPKLEIAFNCAVTACSVGIMAMLSRITSGMDLSWYTTAFFVTVFGLLRTQQINRSMVEHDGRKTGIFNSNVYAVLYICAVLHITTLLPTRPDAWHEILAISIMLILTGLLIFNFLRLYTIEIRFTLMLLIVIIFTALYGITAHSSLDAIKFIDLLILFLLSYHRVVDLDMLIRYQEQAVLAYKIQVMTKKLGIIYDVQQSEVIRNVPQDEHSISD